MNINHFEAQVRSFQSRLQGLQQYTEESPETEDLEVYETVSELSIALEELNVAIEELHRQHEELDAASQIIALERQRYHELFEFAPDGYLVTDINGKIQEVNQAAVKLLRCPKHLLINNFLVGFISIEERSEFRRYLNTKLSLLQNYPVHSATQSNLNQYFLEKELEINLQPKEGKEFPAAIIISPIRHPQGKIIGWRWNVRDITERKRAEETSRQLQRERELNNLKARIMRTVSHEFRTPMNVLSLSAQLLERHFKSKDEQPLLFFSKIQSAIYRLTELLVEISNYSDLEADKIQFQPRMINLIAFCQEVIEELMLNNGNRVILESPLEEIFIETDVKLLRQILTNLLLNALKYSAADTQVILELNADDKKAIATIRDQGIGIPLDDQPYIFEPFYRGNNAVNRAGTGLGLDIVKKAVDLHNGSIRFTSEINKGTTFTVSLPLKQSIAQSIALEPSPLALKP